MNCFLLSLGPEALSPDIGAHRRQDIQAYAGDERLQKNDTNKGRNEAQQSCISKQQI